MSEKRYDALKVLGSMSGLGRSEAKKIWDQVRENQARLDSCPKHSFSGEVAAFGKKLLCASCGGMLGIVEIGMYIKGYVAAGGDPVEVWPEWAKKKIEVEDGA